MAGTEGLRQRLGMLDRQRGGIEPAAIQAQEISEPIAGLRDALRVRESLRRGAEQALPGEEVARGVRVVRSIEPWSRRMPRPAATAVTGVAEPPGSGTSAKQQLRFEPPPWEIPGDAVGPLVFLDTETTGLSGGTGTLVFLLGIAWFVPEGLRVEQWLLTRPSDESRWLDEITRSLPPDAHLVSFNGKAFDLPLLATRFALGRRPSPFVGAGHWDLLFAMRRAFDTRWPDCRLQTAEQRLLGLARFDDLPGAFAPAAYQAFLRGVEPGLLPRVLAHNRQDLVSLAHLIPALTRVYRDPLAFDADAGAIGRGFSRVGRVAEAEAILAPAALVQPRARRELADLLRRQKRWDEAEAQWGPLGRQGCPRACEALAKIAEHVRGNPEAALEWALLAEKAEPGNPRHLHRLARIRRKLCFGASKTANPV